MVLTQLGASHNRQRPPRFFSFAALAVFLGLLLLASIRRAEAECLSGENDNNNSPAGGDEIPKYSARAFFETTTYIMANYAGFAFSPDGRSILYSSDETGVFNAYERPIEGDSSEPPTPLTASTTDAVFAQSYFPKDRRILYNSDRGGNELDHVYVREEDGTVVDLTPGENVKAEFAYFRDDGNSFYVLTNERDPSYFDVYRYSSSSNSTSSADEENNNKYERELVFRNDLGLMPVAGSPDGRWIALSKPRTSADSDLYLVDLMSHDEQESTTDNNTNNNNETAAAVEAVLITEHEGNVEHGAHGFTRDSSQLIYSTNEFGEFSQAWTHDVSTGEKEALVEADWDVSFVILSPTGRYRVSGINQDAQTKITIADTDNNDEPLQLPELPPGDLGQVRFSPDETTVAFLINSDTSPSNIFVVSLADDDSTAAEPVQLTNALNPEICEDYLVEAEVVRYESFDELEIPSILYKPQAASADNKVPALVWVHGGPGGQSRKGYSPSKQHLVNHGYAILAANNRGSDGYGKTFYHMDDKRHGEVDLQDIVYGKNYLQGLDWIDPNRIGIAGGSYGGYMTVAALAFEPNVFDVGIDIFGVTNWLRTLESIPPWWESAREALYDELGDPATDEERLRRISPLFHADKIRKPLLVVQGANDPRVLKVESDEIVEALRNNNVPVKYLVFEDEGHGFLKKSNRINASEAYVSFLSEYLVEPATVGEEETAITDTPSESPFEDPQVDSSGSSSGPLGIASSQSSLTCITWGSLAMLTVAQRLIS